MGMKNSSHSLRLILLLQKQFKKPALLTKTHSLSVHYFPLPLSLVPSICFSLFKILFHCKIKLAFFLQKKSISHFILLPNLLILSTNQSCAVPAHVPGSVGWVRDHTVGYLMSLLSTLSTLRGFGGDTELDVDDGVQKGILLCSVLSVL